MKVFIAVDMEGVAGLLQWDDSQTELEKRLMTEEVNSAARGAFKGGATEVFAGESHDSMRNLMPELLDSRVSYLTGQPKPMNHMAGIDSSFDLALFVGYHSKAGTLRGVMAHTLSVNIFSLSFNGIEIGEIGVDAALCGYHGVPVGLVSGDRAACEEAQSILPGVKVVAVKTGVSYFAGRCMPLEKARAMIEETSADAVAHASDFEPLAIDGPIGVKVVFMTPAHADTLENMDIVTRIDGCTISFEAQDLLKAFEWLNAMAFLSPVVR
jgi:D-amino peptidase